METENNVEIFQVVMEPLRKVAELEFQVGV
jgi:hypothetical protein